MVTMEQTDFFVVCVIAGSSTHNLRCQCRAN